MVTKQLLSKVKRSNQSTRSLTYWLGIVFAEDEESLDVVDVLL